MPDFLIDPVQLVNSKSNLHAAAIVNVRAKSHTRLVYLRTYYLPTHSFHPSIVVNVITTITEFETNVDSLLCAPSSCIHVSVRSCHTPTHARLREDSRDAVCYMTSGGLDMRSGMLTVSMKRADSGLDLIIGVR